MVVEIANASSDMLLPLKVGVGALSILLKNYDVSTTKCVTLSATRSVLQQTTANADQIRNIEGRVQSLGEVLASPLAHHDSEEKARREALRKSVLPPRRDAHI